MKELLEIYNAEETALEWYIRATLLPFDKYDDDENKIGIEYWSAVTGSSDFSEYVEKAREIEIEQKNSYKKEILKHLNILMSMPSSKLDLYIDKNGLINEKWFEQ
jgi:hypothetical protein